MIVERKWTMVKYILILVCAANICMADFKPKLLFSTDRGATWQEDFPILRNDLFFCVKLNGRIFETRELGKIKTASCTLVSNEKFPQAERRIPWTDNRFGTKVQYKNLSGDLNLKWTIDLSGRKKGAYPFSIVIVYFIRENGKDRAIRLTEDFSVKVEK